MKGLRKDWSPFPYNESKQHFQQTRFKAPFPFLFYIYWYVILYKNGRRGGSGIDTYRLFFACELSAITQKLLLTVWYVARYGISHCLAFAWSFERMRMYAAVFFYLHVIFIYLHELPWHSNGSINCQTLVCHSNG